MHYNLLTKPWLHLIDLEGKHRRGGIIDALGGAHGLSAVYGLTATHRYAAMRLLTAIVQDIVKPEKPEDIADLLNDGEFGTEIDDWGDDNEEYYNLFGESPFLQSVVDEDRVMPSSAMSAELPGGINVTHFRHIRDEDSALCVSCFAYGLIELIPFATAYGKRGGPGINGAPPFYVYPIGRTLFESLVYGLVLPEYATKGAGDAEWRMDRPNERVGYESVGLLHGLTFMPRTIQGFPMETLGHCLRCGMATDIVIKNVFHAPGRKYTGAGWRDPFVPYVSNSTGETKPARPPYMKGKPLTRIDYPTYFRELVTGGTERRQVTPPSIVSQHRNTSVTPLAYMGVALRTDYNAKFFESVDTIIKL